MATMSREMSRAERFEDEKRRIIESCFNKKDEHGSLIETYITHIKITEFSSHPTSPPPPQSRTPNSEKHRVIIVAVRQSGRVRVHKSKENMNGTFSIGKTWDLNDLSAIESYTSANTSPEFRQWAGNVGFLITLGKPYYWQAQIDKEKKFFIASLLKIYHKYSGGKVPLLSGFDQAELEQIQSGASQRRPAQSVSVQPQPPAPAPALPAAPAAPSAPSVPPVPPPPLSAREPVSTSQGSYGGSMGSTGSAGPGDYRGRAALLSNGVPSPAASFDSGRSANPAAMRRPAGINKSQESVAASVAAASITGRSDDGVNSLPPRSRNGPMNGAGPASYGQGDGTAPASGERPPERKRPPMDPSRPQGLADDGLVPAPLMSSTRTRDAVAPPPRSSHRTVAPFAESAGRADMTPPPLRSPLNGVVNAALPTLPPSQPSPQQRPPSSAAGAVPAPVSPLVTTSIAPATGTATTTPTSKTASEASTPFGSASTPARNPSILALASASTPPASPPEPPSDSDDNRPGLGPMIKKKSRGDIAGAFWKAAAAASAFKPRPGGAGERLRQAQNKSHDGPDGITSVVPAPRRPVSVEKPALATVAAVAAAAATGDAGRPKTPLNTSGIPEVKVTIPNASQATSAAELELAAKTAEAAKAAAKAAAEAEAAAAEAESSPRKSVVAGNDAKYLSTLGAGPMIMDKRSAEFAKWLDYFGWVPGDRMRSVNLEDIKIDLDRELNRAQAGGWLARFQEEDERVDAISKGIDTAIDECEELDNLLTLYSVELSTLSDDIAYIEAQGQGLQVQAANQKLLKKELESLLDTCAITSTDLEALRSAPLESVNGIEEIETALVTLYKAMSKIDPTMGSLEANSSAGSEALSLTSDFGQMRVVREKKEMYTAESSAFMRRLVVFMASQFDLSMSLARKAMESALARKVDPRSHQAGRDVLWKYGPLMLYAREADLGNWDRIIQIYQEKSHPLYKSEFRDVLGLWKKNARKPVTDDSEVLFTSLQEKKEEGIATTARKLTVKRSQTLARTLRSPLGDSSSNSNSNSSGGSGNNSSSNSGSHGSRAHVDKANDSRSHPYEVFTSVLDELLPLVQMEQNFVIEFFHATTLQPADFADVVAASRPRDRQGVDLRRNRPMEPDRDLARRITRAMEAIFSFVEQDLQGLMDWVLAMDPLQGIGVLATLERKMADISQSNQDFLSNVLQKLHSNLEGRFKKFVDEQIRAIEETKVKIKKRKGVIGFMRVFPHFSTAVENMLADVDPHLGVRRMVDREYDRILRSMFESLKVIARENPMMTGAGAAVATAGGAGGGGGGIGGLGIGGSGADPEDKEALNFHILLIENMNHFLEDVDNQRGNEVLNNWKEAAAAELKEHMGLYLNTVMRRPLGRLLEQLENIEAQLATGKSASAVAAQPSNSKTVFNKVLGSYDAKEVRKGIETLRKRVEKHFSSDSSSSSGGGGGGGGDDSSSLAPSSLQSHHLHLPNYQHQNNSGGNSTLVTRVLRECEAFYGDVELRIGRITTNVYGGDVLYEWPRADVKMAFSSVGK